MLSAVLNEDANRQCYREQCYPFGEFTVDHKPLNSVQQSVASRFMIHEGQFNEISASSVHLQSEFDQNQV